MFRTTPRRLAAISIAALCLLAACGDDDDTTGVAAEEEDGELAAYCDAAFALETVAEPEIDFDAMSPEEQAEAAKEFATETLRPAADELIANAPEELAEDIEVLDSSLTEVEETGDFSVLESDEFKAAEANAHEHDLANCGWEAVEVNAIDYAFEGFPSTMEAGKISLEFTNDSEHEEFHELALFKKNDGVTESATELLELPEEEAETMAEFVAGTFAPPGESNFAVTELEAGDYFVACFIPVGATEENEEGTGPPHFVQGMVAEFSVE